VADQCQRPKQCQTSFSGELIMAHFSRLRYRIALLSCIILTLCFFCHNRVEKYRTPSGALSAQQWLSKHASASSNPLHNRLNLNEQDCRATFPLLFTTIDASIARGSFNFSRSPTDYQGLIQARIRNNVVRPTSPSTFLPRTFPLRV
jgi:hypothetical protein